MNYRLLQIKNNENNIQQNHTFQVAKTMKAIRVKGHRLASGQFVAKTRRSNGEELSSDDWSVVTNILKLHINTQPIPTISKGFPYNFEIVF